MYFCSIFRADSPGCFSLSFLLHSYEGFFPKMWFYIHVCSEQSAVFLKSPFTRNKWELCTVNTIQNYTVILDLAEFDGPGDSSIKIIFQKIMVLEDYALYWRKISLLMFSTSWLCHRSLSRTKTIYLVGFSGLILKNGTAGYKIVGEIFIPMLGKIVLFFFFVGLSTPPNFNSLIE